MTRVALGSCESRSAFALRACDVVLVSSPLLSHFDGTPHSDPSPPLCPLHASQTNLEQRRTTAEDAAPLRWKIHWQGIVQELDRIAGFDVHDRPMDDDADLAMPQCADEQYSYDGDVFFIHGGASRFVRHSHIATIASYFPNHMLTTIRGVGHWVHAEAPDDTIALLKQYLDR